MRFSLIRDGRFVIGGAVLLGSIAIGATARAQAAAAPKVVPPPTPTTNPVCSAYTCDTQTVTIRYKTRRRWWTGAPILVEVPGPDQALKILWQTPTGVPPAEWVLVSIEYSYRGATGRYQTPAPVQRGKDSYSVPLEPFINDLIQKHNQKLPPGFDPNSTIALDGPAVVKVTPILPANDPNPPQPNPQGLYKTGAETPTCCTLVVVFQPVL
jgi:hypothetical protein